ncbi:ABC transporter substrate-binding protein [Pseudofrankia sp. DC12]|uniref:ABC transporter substrate-binding protein n=1 Tax=Pseudofrankia sp. DC12 TaxID=683315 RepID=UPI0005F87D6B|nr:ABC transporter substrate-binding protein [Pseudofrankia sp. DC12]
MNRRRVPRAALALGLASLTSVALLTACGGSTTPSRSSTATQPAANVASRASYPVDVTNCGRTLHFDHAPARVISGWPTSSDLLVALGLGKAVVGQYNTSQGTPAAAQAAAVDAIPVLAENAPSREQLLAARPDLIWADGSYLFDGQQLPTINDLAAGGTQVMILSGFCTDDATRAKVTDVQADLTTLGKIFGVPDRAARLNADIGARLDAVTAKTGGLPPMTVAMISTFDGSIYTYGGVYTDIATRAGARNIYAGTLPAGQYYGELSKERLLKDDPATLVYLLSGGESESDARAFLTKTLPTMTAVRAGKIAFLPQWDSTNLAGIQGVETLAAALHP